MQLSIGYINDVRDYLEAHKELFYEDGDEIIKQVGDY